MNSKKQSTKILTASFSAILYFGVIVSLALFGCSSATTNSSQSNNVRSDTSTSITEQQSGTNKALKEVYSQAIGDYLRVVKEEYNLTFDTLFFGKHVNGQPTDFPDIELPAIIDGTKIQLISPEQGEENQKKNKSSFYVNLIGSVNSETADFIFVTFSNGFDHQFDCFLEYTHSASEEKFVLATSRFENYRFKKE